MKSLVQLRAMLKDDVYDDFTPYAARLRFGGPIKVFLPSGLSNWIQFKTFMDDGPDLRLVRDYQISHIPVVTKNSFYMVKNEGHNLNNASSYPEYIFTQTMALKAAGLGLDLTMLPLTGKVVSLSLAALRYMDSYYMNGHLSVRIKVPLETSCGNTLSSAQTYVTESKRFVRYDPHGKEHKLVHGVNFSCAPKKLAGGKNCYAM
jgi:hypothetical protein